MTLPRGPVYMDLHVALSWSPLCLPHQIKWPTALSIDVACCWCWCCCCCCCCCWCWYWCWCPGPHLQQSPQKCWKGRLLVAGPPLRRQEGNWGYLHRCSHCGTGSISPSLSVCWRGGWSIKHTSILNSNLILYIFQRNLRYFRFTLHW